MKIKIKNFRSFNDMDYIEIKPITILIGRNSSGKSSFLRTFPMLKQSFEERTRSPILLYGNYIDFGSYKDIKPNFIKNNDDYNYELGFIFDKNIFIDINRYCMRKTLERISYTPKEFFDIKFNIIFEEHKKELIHIKELNYFLEKNEIEFKLNEKNELMNLTVNNEIIITLDDNIKYIDRGDFLLDFYVNKNEQKYTFEKYLSEKIKKFILHLIKKDFKEDKLEEEQDKITTLISTILKIKKDSNTEINDIHTENNLENFSVKTLEEYFNININKNKLEDEVEKKFIKIQSIKILDDSFILDQLKNKVFKSLALNWNEDNLEFIKIKNLIILYNFIDKFMTPISNYFKQTFLNVKYIAPLRATAERFYRIQHLSVNEVDQNGTNLPSFLDSLNETQIKEFQSWTKENFNFSVDISKEGGHYSIIISLKDGININLSDMGFGYSQILPILTQLWYSSTKYDKNRRVGFNYFQKIIVIEQPELHLHPEFQAKFTNMLVKVLKYAKNNKTDLKIIIETHSDILINRLGDLIIDDKINANQINIVIFDKESEEKPTNISLAKYDNDGNLLNWPLGFFQPSL